ncbi:hypothetical protein LguiB_031238 [Lonicera macranthoides]
MVCSEYTNKIRMQQFSLKFIPLFSPNVNNSTKISKHLYAKQCNTHAISKFSN